MQTVRVYKDNLREHILRTMFFTDTAVLIAGGGIIAAGILACCTFALHIHQPGIIISTIFVTETVYALIATVKIENQPIYSLIPRSFGFTVRPKILPMKQIRKTTGDFTIWGNYIYRKKKLIALYEIHPIDLALLNEEQRDTYYHQIKMMLHTLPGGIQLIAKKKNAQVEDYHQHFFSLFSTATEKVNPLMEQYIKELSSFIQSNKLQIMKYYLVFSTPVLSSTDEDFQKATQRLEDKAKRITTSLAPQNIHLTKLTNQEVIHYFKNEFASL